MAKAFVNHNVFSFTSLHFTSLSDWTDQKSSPVCFSQTDSIVTESEINSLEAIRAAGAQLDDAFVAMAADVIDQDDAEAIFLTVESRQLKGLRYQGEVYRLIESVAVHHRLQAFCLGQALKEQLIPHLITRSSDQFAVWINIRALPYGDNHSHLPSAPNLAGLGR